MQGGLFDSLRKSKCKKDIQLQQFKRICKDRVNFLRMLAQKYLDTGDRVYIYTKSMVDVATVRGVELDENYVKPSINVNDTIVGLSVWLNDRSLLGDESDLMIVSRSRTNMGGSDRYEDVSKSYYSYYFKKGIPSSNYDDVLNFINSCRNSHDLPTYISQVKEQLRAPDQFYESFILNNLWDEFKMHAGKPTDDNVFFTPGLKQTYLGEAQAAQQQRQGMLNAQRKQQEEINKRMICSEESKELYCKHYPHLVEKCGEDYCSTTVPSQQSAGGKKKIILKGSTRKCLVRIDENNKKYIQMNKERVYLHTIRGKYNYTV